MITFLLAVINFVVTVALHVLEISIKVAIQALKISAKTAKVAVKQGKKVTKKAAKKGAETTKKTARDVKGKIKEDLTENTKPETPQTADVRDVITSEDDVKDKVQKDKGGLTALKNINIKGMKLLQKSVHNALVLSRICMIAVTIFVFVLTSLLITSSFAIISSAGYVALAYNNGVLGTNEDSDSSFDITKDGKDEDKDDSVAENVSNDGSVNGKLETISMWYVNHIPTYSNDYHHNGKPATKSADNYYAKVKNDNEKSHIDPNSSCRLYYCDLTDTFVRDDCTGFAAAFASYVSGKTVTTSCSSSMLNSWDATNKGWTKYSRSSAEPLQTGDICVKSGHAEVYIDKSHTFGWGGVHNSYPTSNTLNSAYVTVYRYTGK